MTHKRPPLVLIEWEDSWFDIDELPDKPIPAILYSDRVVLVMSYQDDNHDVFVIPTGCIRKRTVLRK